MDGTWGVIYIPIIGWENILKQDFLLYLEWAETKWNKHSMKGIFLCYDLWKTKREAIYNLVGAAGAVAL